jgi:hypothetical protein
MSPTQKYKQLIIVIKYKEVIKYYEPKGQMLSLFYARATNLSVNVIELNIMLNVYLLLMKFGNFDFSPMQILL